MLKLTRTEDGLLPSTVVARIERRADIVVGYCFGGDADYRGFAHEREEIVEIDIYISVVGFDAGEEVGYFDEGGADCRPDVVFIKRLANFRRDGVHNRFIICRNSVGVEITQAGSLWIFWHKPKMRCMESRSDLRM